MTLRYAKNGMSGTDIRSYQRLLNDRGGYGLQVDGIWGPKTDSAVRSFQSAHGLTADGIIGEKTCERLLEG
jgi:peptidoglycan hydrolase-like protein with peptidoglycan-binding domain